MSAMGVLVTLLVLLASCGLSPDNPPPHILFQVIDNGIPDKLQCTNAGNFLACVAALSVDKRLAINFVGIAHKVVVAVQRLGPWRQHRRDEQVLRASLFLVLKR